MNSSTERTCANARPASRVVESASSAVQRIASANEGWSAGPVRPAATPESEITGPWRVERTRTATSAAPLTLMTSSAVSNAAQPSGVW